MSFAKTPRFKERKVRTQGSQGTVKKIKFISPRNKGKPVGASGPGASAQDRRKYRLENPIEAGPPKLNKNKSKIRRRI